MKLLTKEQRTKLLKNNATPDEDKKPVVKLFSPVGAATWLLSSIDENDIAFGLCDLGMGEPELGFVCLQELEEIKLPLGLTIERDIHFKANKTLTQYADEARNAGRIIA